MKRDDVIDFGVWYNHGKSKDGKDGKDSKESKESKESSKDGSKDSSKDGSEINGPFGVYEASNDSSFNF
jgi:hypothetical protein